MPLRPKPWWLAVSFITGFLFAMWAEELVLHPRAGELHVAAPRLHFLTGNALSRLKNGAAVPYDFQLSLSAGSRTNLLHRALQRFVVSYDLWEEKYSVTKLSTSSMRTSRSSERRSVSHLTADSAEAWCVDNIALSLSGVPADDSLWVRLEIRAVEANEPPSLFGESGVALSRLVEIFSRPARSDQQRWTAETGPFKLEELRASSGRGT
jgi:hypothetical protein